MRYQKANEILPKELVELIQSYMDGGYVYIPRKEENRKSWGETSSARKEIQAGNEGTGAGGTVLSVGEEYPANSASGKKAGTEE